MSARLLTFLASSGFTTFSRPSAIAVAVTAALVLIGVNFGTRMFKNESA